MQQLKQSGLNDRDIQTLRNAGALDQINAQGSVDKWLTSEKGLQALEQISATGQEAIKQIQAQGGIDQRLQKLRSASSGTNWCPG